MFISDCTFTSLMGYEKEFLFQEQHEICKEIIKPDILRGLAPRVDFATALSVSAVTQLKANLNYELENKKTGILVGTKSGNHMLAKSFGDRVRKGSSSPAMYSTAGYNMCASIPALVTQYQGPAIVLPGRNTSIANCILTACNYINRNDAQTMFVGLVDVEKEGEWGAAFFFRVSKNPEDHSKQITFINQKQLNNISTHDQMKTRLLKSSFLQDAYTLYEFCSENIEGDQVRLDTSFNSILEVSRKVMAYER